MLRLKRFTIENYRCFQSLTLDVPEGGLSVFIGPNGSGKSTILDALDLVAVSTRSQSGLLEAIGQRGPIDQLLPWGGQSSQPSRFVLELDGNPFGMLTYEMSLGMLRGFPAAAFEHVRQATPAAVRTLLQADARDAFAYDLDGELQVRIDPSHQRGTVLSTIAGSGVAYVRGLAEVRVCIGAGAVYGHFSTEPGWFRPIHDRNEGARSPATGVGQDLLDSRAENLQSVLMVLKSDNTERWDTLIRSFSVAFPIIEQLDFKSVGGRQALAVRRRGDKQLRPATDALSDGMFCWLSILTAFALAEQSGGALCFDEPEIGLHPELLGLFVGHAEIHAAKFGPVFLATHSDLLLDALENPADAIVTMGPTTDGDVAATRLNAEALDAWRKQYRDVSTLRRHGLLGGKRM